MCVFANRRLVSIDVAGGVGLGSDLVNAGNRADRRERNYPGSSLRSLRRSYPERDGDRHQRRHRRADVPPDHQRRLLVYSVTVTAHGFRQLVQQSVVVDALSVVGVLRGFVS
jgi:hypothetical protein